MHKANVMQTESSFPNVQYQDLASPASSIWDELAIKNKHPRSLLCIQKYSLVSHGGQPARKHHSRAVRSNFYFLFSLSFYSDVPAPGTNEQELDELIARVQEELKLHNYLNYSNIREALLRCDKDESGFLNKAKFLSVCDSLKVPTSAVLVNKVRRKGCCAYWVSPPVVFWKMSFTNQPNPGWINSHSVLQSSKKRVKESQFRKASELLDRTFLLKEEVTIPVLYVMQVVPSMLWKAWSSLRDEQKRRLQIVIEKHRFLWSYCVVT